MLTTDTNRAEILEEIQHLENRLRELRGLLPTSIKQFFCFRCKPESHVWIYAESHEQAKERLIQRMNDSYGSLWKIASQSVDTYTNPADAAARTPGNLFRCLSLPEAREFLADWQANRTGRAETVKLKHVAKTGLEIDAENFEKYLRQLDQR